MPTPETATMIEPGNYAPISDIIVIQVVTDEPLLSLGALVTASAIESGNPVLDASNLTGDPGFSQGPLIADNEVLFTIGDFNGICRWRFG